MERQEEQQPRKRPLPGVRPDTISTSGEGVACDEGTTVAGGGSSSVRSASTHITITTEDRGDPILRTDEKEKEEKKLERINEEKNKEGTVETTPMEEEKTKSPSPLPERPLKRQREEFAPLPQRPAKSGTSKIFVKFWTIARKDKGSFKTVSPVLIHKHLSRSLGEVASVTKTAAGHLVVGVADESQANKIRKLSSLATLEVATSEHATLNSSRGVIFCRDLMNCSIEEIKEDLADQGVVDVRQVTRRVGKDESVPTGTFFLTFSSVDPPERIRVAFYRGIRVRRYIPAPLRCFKCLKFGHVSLRCRQEHVTCSCGRPEHVGTDCTSPMKCVNCDGDHPSRSAQCPEFALEKEIQRVKAIHKLTYPEARKMVRDKAYAMPAVSYAAKAAAPKPQVNAKKAGEGGSSPKSPMKKGPEKATSPPTPKPSTSDKKEEGLRPKHRRSSASPAPSSVKPDTKERGCGTSPGRYVMNPRHTRACREEKEIPPMSPIEETEDEEKNSEDDGFTRVLNKKSPKKKKKGGVKGRPRKHK